ncbi:MAG: cupin domain-containing protein [Nitratireductor sp.]
MPKIDIESLPIKTGSGYPAPFDEVTKGRSKKQLGDAGGLTQFGINLTTIKPNSGTAIRHWHEEQDEFVFILSGTATLVEDDGETTLKAGDAASFKAGVANGHCILNKSDADVVLLEMGTRTDTETGHYPDIDLLATKDGDSYIFTHKDGTPY